MDGDASIPSDFRQVTPLGFVGGDYGLLVALRRAGEPGGLTMAERAELESLLRKLLLAVEQEA
jgi:hypothetical protein